MPVEHEDNDSRYRLPGQYQQSDNAEAVTSGAAPVYEDNDSHYQLPGSYVTRDNPDVAVSVKAGVYGGSMERVARSMLGANASQREVNNYVGQLLELNGINDPRRVQAGQDILLPDANTPAATKGLAIYGKDIALGEQMKMEAAQAQRERWDAMQTGAWSGRTDPGGPVWHVGGASIPSASMTSSSPGVVGYLGGAIELVASGAYNQAVRIGGGLASIPYAVFGGVDAAVAVQDAARANLGYAPRSDGAAEILGHLAPVAKFVQNNVINPTRAFSEAHLGDGVTTVFGASLEVGLEIGATVTGIRAAGGVGTAVMDNAFAGPVAGGRSAQLGGINFGSPRYQPGVVSFGDDLVTASGRWLDATTPTPIPLQVAQALEGKSFKTFPELQSAVWKSIGNDADLSASFGQQALGQMAIGNAPFAPKAFQNAQFGGRFNLHHVNPIAAGGSVYDLSNIRIVSPRVHSGIHYR